LVGEIGDEQMAIYRATARRRRGERLAALAARQVRASELARLAAERLRRDFGATRVVLIGSLARGRHFDERSDIDLVAWDVPETLYYEALAMLLGLDSEFSFDLIMGESARPIIREAIQRDGKEI
jgi:predicted nucleotidyltransferase